MRTKRQFLALAGAVGALYALGALSTFWYFDDPAAGAAFFPAAGLTVAALLLTPRRAWPWILSAVALAEISVDLSHGQSVTMAFGFAAANVAEPLAGALLLRTAVRKLEPRTRGYLVEYVMCAVVIAPIVGAAIGAGVATLHNGVTFSDTMFRWWVGDALGVLVVATPLLAWSRRTDFDVRAGLAEDVAIACIAAAVTIVPAYFWHHGTVTYVVLPVLMFAALRGGPLSVGISGAAVAFSADWLIVSGHMKTLFAVRDSEHSLIDVQLFIGITILAALAFAVEVAERTRVQRALGAAEARAARDELAGSAVAAKERERIAREAHDIVGHSLNFMIMSAGAARRVLDNDAPAAKELLATAENVGREAFRDLDAALGLVDQSPDLAPQRGLADLEELVDRLARAGLDIECNVDGQSRSLPRLVDWSAYRIIQESLTNVVKHAGNVPTRIDLSFTPSSVRFTVVNGRPVLVAVADGRRGRGLRGMRERVAVLGGRIDTGPVPDGGFQVSVELPAERA